MTVRRAAAGIYTRQHGTYNIGFVNNEGGEDETQFENVKSIRELQELFSGFCKENNFPENTVLYVERA
ncbi:MAG: hypothetical protein K2L82_14115 [Lachnospiraceae bacterium]|nr:hypothetical protein [Lachnospiraceae bacterium]